MTWTIFKRGSPSRRMTSAWRSFDGYCSRSSRCATLLPRRSGMKNQHLHDIEEAPGWIVSNSAFVARVVARRACGPHFRRKDVLNSDYRIGVSYLHD